MPGKFKVDLKQLVSSRQVENLSKHLNGYEKRVKELVKELNLKSRDAREKSKVQLDRFASHVRKTRTEVEKNVKTLFHQESKVLNQKLNDLVQYLKGLSSSERKAAEAPVAAPKKAKSSKKAGSRAKKVAPRRAAGAPLDAKVGEQSSAPQA